jgi:very-short-patch-repair endonuclease/DNA polymerase III delta prime subunit
VISASRQQAVIEAVRQWQTRLLQLDRRNALLYFAMGKRGVALRDTEPDALLERLAASRLGLAFTYAERARVDSGELFGVPTATEEPAPEPQVRVRPGDLEADLPPLELQKRLGALSKRNREWQEEQGLNVLFIALGFLRWVDEDQEPACSPILLVPCDLTRESPRDPYRLVGEESDDPVVNPTLRHKLTTAAGITLPEIGEETIAGYLAAVERLVGGREGWSVEMAIVIATFPFSKLAMWEDLNLIASAGVTHPLLRRLAGDSDAPIEQATDHVPMIPKDDVQLSGAKLDDLLDIRDQHTVVDADFSQLRAIELARSGTNLVIHGPPGTGKSQTIANIIATLLSEGRRVLFVSEKTAALDIVKRRLAEVGLGGFCLDLHSDRAKKTSVYAQLRTALDQSPAKQTRFPYQQLVTRRNELNAIVRALHEIRQPLGLSVFAVHGCVAAIRDVPHFSIEVDDVASLDDGRLRLIQQAARRIARHHGEFRDHHSSRWHVLGPVAPSPRLVDTMRDDLVRLQSALDAAAHAALQASKICGVATPADFPQAETLMRLLAHLKSIPVAVPAQWLEPNGLQRAEADSSSLRNDADARRRLVDMLSSSLSNPSAAPWAPEWLDVTHAIASGTARWESLAGGRWSTVLLADPGAEALKWRSIANMLDALADASNQLQAQLGLPPIVFSRSAADAILDLAGRLQRIGTIPDSWSSAEAVLAVRAEVAAAHDLRNQLVDTEGALTDFFGPEIVDRVDDEMLVRYRTDYRNLFRWLRPAYRRDHRTLRGCLRRPGPLSVHDAATAIERALALRVLRSRWSATASHVRELLGDRFTGIDSSWAGIDSALDSVACLYREHPAQISALHAVLADPQTVVWIEESAKTVRDRISALDAAWPNGVLRRAWPDGVLRQDEHLCVTSSDALSFAEAAARVGVIVDALGPFSTRPIDLDFLIQLLQMRTRLHEADERGEAASQTRGNTLGAFFSAWATDFGILDRALSWTRELVALMHGSLPTALAKQLTEPQSTVAYAAAQTGLGSALAQLRAAYSAAAPRFPEERSPWGSWDLAPFMSAKVWCEDLRAHADEASDWVDYRAAVEALDATIADGAATALRSATDDSSLVPDMVLRHVYLFWLENVYNAVPELQFGPQDAEDTITEFRELDARLPQAARERVRARCLATREGISNSHGMGEVGILSHQISLRKRQMPVRKLVAKIPNLLQRLQPCFMMSPLAVSQYLPRGTTNAETLSFDTVIFDEASQVFPEDAVAAIARGSQSIVVGDRQQLPPSHFFRSDPADDDYDEDGDGEGTDSNRLYGVESILDVLVGMCGSGVEDVYLKVHYRSQHEALIRYSNHYFYEDRLLTFPSALGARPGLGIRSVYLPDGRFESGGSKTNRVEAEQVVRIVFDLMETQPSTESIGVVALSRAQSDLIQELIDLRRLADRQFDQRFAEEAHERFFVKNLENVQGDERDHVILSIGYGPTTGSGIVPNRFGPVNLPGGHRRLNVAVSRARRSMTVVHSLRPEDIHSESQGAKLLRRYLEFLRNGEASIEGALDQSPGGDAESPFEEAVGRALVERGYCIKRQVGCAKYAIDIAVQSENGNGFDLAIECDGKTYHSSPSARDRDRLRQDILERMGWRGRIHRVWSTAWIRNARAEIESIERAIRASRAMPCEAPPVAAPPQRTSPQTEVASDPSSLVSDSAEAAPNSVLVPYAEADIRCFPHGTDLRKERAARIADLVAAIVKAEAPIHIDVVVERIRHHYQLQRAGNRVRDAVLLGARDALHRGIVEWLPLADSSGRRSDFLVTTLQQQITPRGPMQNGSVRDISYLSDQEIEAAVVRIVRAMVGASKRDVIIATARAFGYARTGEVVEGRVTKAVDRLLETGTLTERVGSLVVPD